MNELVFTVYGTPIPQGSTKAFIPKGWNRPIITADNAKTKPWRQQISGTADTAIFNGDFVPFKQGQAVYVECEFYFDKPKSAGKKVIHKTTKPDLDKLQRSLLDALTGIVFTDDSQVVDIQARKRFGSPARVEVTVGECPWGAV